MRHNHQTVAITLVAVIHTSKVFATFCNHHTLQHNLNQVMKTIFFLRMPSTLTQKVVPLSVP